MVTEKGMDEATKIGNSSYDQEWLVETLAKKDDAFYSRLKETQIAKISFKEIGTGKGFLSNVYKLTIDFTDAKEPFLAVIKIPSTSPLVSVTVQRSSSDAGEEVSKIDELHSRECDFYERFGNLHILPLPKIYAVERSGMGGREGVVLMENLTEKGTMIDVFDSVTTEQLRSLTKFLAQLTAYSIRLPDEDVEQYRPSKYFVNAIFKVNMESGPKAAASWSNGFKDLYKRIEHLFLKPHYIEYTFTAINKELGIKPVLVHGDFWVNNIFWKKDADGECSNDIYAVIDWQVMHAGTIGHDLSLILTCCCDQEIRRDAEKWIFNFLCDRIEAELQGSGLAIPFSPEQVEASYRRAFVGQAIQLFSFAHLWLTEEIPAEKQSKILLRTKSAMEDAVSTVENILPEWLDPSFVPEFLIN